MPLAHQNFITGLSCPFRDGCVHYNLQPELTAHSYANPAFPSAVEAGKQTATGPPVPRYERFPR